MYGAAKVELRNQHGIPVIALDGEITGELQAPVQDVFQKIDLQQSGRVIIDFSRAVYINSSGIAILIDLVNQCQSSDTLMEFASLNDQIYKIMDLVGLFEFVRVWPELKDAY
ncbi:MAG: STAS domain-containing protein [Leptospiraceae bacterium]|nr:STAS domain-containing protein [Leptospiraceae bacterium]